jgi:hypothetical protein
MHLLAQGLVVHALAALAIEFEYRTQREDQLQMLLDRLLKSASEVNGPDPGFRRAVCQSLLSLELAHPGLLARKVGSLSELCAAELTFAAESYMMLMATTLRHAALLLDGEGDGAQHSPALSPQPSTVNPDDPASAWEAVRRADGEAAKPVTLAGVYGTTESLHPWYVWCRHILLRPSKLSERQFRLERYVLYARPQIAAFLSLSLSLSICSPHWSPLLAVESRLHALFTLFLLPTKWLYPFSVFALHSLTT